MKDILKQSTTSSLTYNSMKIVKWYSILPMQILTINILKIVIGVISILRLLMRNHQECLLHEDYQLKSLALWMLIMLATFEPTALNQGY